MKTYSARKKMWCTAGSTSMPPTKVLGRRLAVEVAKRLRGKA